MGKSVIIVDFSYKYDVLVALADKAASVLVIDHHKTAMADLVDVPPAELHYEAHQKNSTGKLHALFDMKRSGAGLTWDFFFPVQPRPPLINHIEDRDLWLFKLEGTREIMADLFSYPQDFATWDRLFADEINWIRLDGVAINRQHQKTVTDLVHTTKRRMLIGGHDVPVSNLPYMFASDAGHLMAEGELFAGSYFDTPDGRTFSLRSTDAGMDVSEIAKQYGGGGHRNAAGFRVPLDHPLSSPDMGEVERLKSTIEDLQVALSQESDRADNAGRNASAFEDRMGNLQVRNGKLCDEQGILRAQLAERDALLLWALYHHQGGKSDVGQPIRRLLGIGQHDDLTDEQIRTAALAGGRS
jgi:hypothetical protein